MTDLAEPSMEVKDQTTAYSPSENMPNPLFITRAGSAGEMPDFDPPNEESQATASEDGATSSVWLNNKKVTSLWSYDSSENAFAAIDGVGWRRIDRSSPAAFTNLAMILSAAAQNNANCRILLTDDVITTVYAF